MTNDVIFDRYVMRRKLRRWRIATILIAVIAVLGIISLNTDLIDQDHIAHVKISGIIQDDERLLALLDNINKDERAKALIISISSPGGTTYGGEKIYKAVKNISSNKPVIADIRTMATSAGYMIASGANHIIAGDNSIVGSIGVIFQYPQLSELMDKIGVSLEEIKSSPLKAAPSPFQNADEDAKDMIRDSVMDSYQWFVDIVQQNRGFDAQTALKLSDGSIFTGRQAVQNGLVDEIGNEGVIKAFLERENIDPDLPILNQSSDRVGNGGLLTNLLYTFILQNIDISNISTADTPLTELIFLDGLVSFWHPIVH